MCTPRRRSGHPSLSTISEEDCRISDDDDVFTPSLDQLLQQEDSISESVMRVKPEVVHEEVEAACREVLHREHRIEVRGRRKVKRLIKETYYKKETRIRIRRGLRTETRITVRIEEIRTRIFHPCYKVTSNISMDRCDQEEPIIVEEAPEVFKSWSNRNGTAARGGCRMGLVNGATSGYLSDTISDSSF